MSDHLETCDGSLVVPTINKEITVLRPDVDVWPLVDNIHACFAAWDWPDPYDPECDTRFMRRKEEFDLSIMDSFWLLRFVEPIGPCISTQYRDSIRKQPSGEFAYYGDTRLPAYVILSIKTKANVVIDDPHGIFEFLTS